ncbi:MAG: hypothetical protein U0165_15585 [Polyangiaceae bacterium]
MRGGPIIATHLFFRRDGGEPIEGADGWLDDPALRRSARVIADSLAQIVARLSFCFVWRWKKSPFKHARSRALIIEHGDVEHASVLTSVPESVVCERVFFFDTSADSAFVASR